MDDRRLDTAPPPFRRNLRDSLRLLGVIVRLSWGTAPWMLTTIVAVSVIAAALPIAQLFLSKAVIDRVSIDLGLMTAGSSLAERAPVGVWIGLAVAGLALGLLIEPIARTLESLISDRLTGRLTERLIRASNRWRGIARFEDPAFADDLKTARDHSDRIGMDLITIGTEVLVIVATSIGVVIVLATLNPIIPAVLILTSLPLIVRTWDFGSRVGSTLYWKIPGARKLEYLRNTLMQSEPAKDIRLYGIGSFFQQRYDETLADVQGTVDRTRWQLLPGMTIANILSAGAASGVYVWVIVAIAEGRRPLGDLALYGAAALILQARLEQLGTRLGMIPFYMQHLPSLGRIVEAGPDLPEPEQPAPVPRPLREGVAFDNITFTYPGAASPTLHDVSLTIPAGGSLALVGLNGSGKTTIVKLLLRLYDPDSGTITVDGIDLRTIDLDDLRRNVSVTFQDYIRYNLTAAANIAVGDLSALGDDDRLMAAARLSGADRVIDGLKDELRTELGREFGAHDLSAGQWQRIALARTFVRDAQLLILDEPTAALDIQTEHDIYTRFQALTRDRTTLLISHRLSAVRLADRILFLEGGTVIETGSHAELMELGGRYARLYRLQAAHYGIDPDASQTAATVTVAAGMSSSAEVTSG